MIPPFLQTGLLPPGIHQATVTEFEERFVRFDRSDQRIRVYAGLRRLFEQLPKLAFVTRVLVAGSFVTAKPEPNDFDCLLIVDDEKFPQDLRPFEYQVVSRRAAAKTFGGDVISVAHGSQLYLRYLQFFQTTRDGQPVGMVEIIQ